MTHGSPGASDSPEPLTPDGLPARYTAQFALGLIGVLLIGFLSLSRLVVANGIELPATALIVPGTVLTAAVLFAIFARLKWGWRGAPVGALTGLGILLLVATLFYTIMHRIDAAIPQ